MTAITYARRRRAGAAAEEMRADRPCVALGEDLGRGGVFGQYRGLQTSSAPARIDRHADLRGQHHGRGRRHGAGRQRPVVEMRFIDFALCAVDEMVNQAAKNRYMFGGQGRVPLVVRQPIGIWSASAAQHSQSLEAWFAHLPGLVVVAPATAAGQLTAC
jgi:pyruvate/2-oxoglutarate/acetoin dehydrogenase E1 component